MMSADANEPVNPYASPAGLEGSVEQDPSRVLMAIFEVDRAWQREQVSFLSRRQDVACLVVLVAAWVVSFAVSIKLNWSDFAPIVGIAVGLFIGFFAGAFCGLILMLNVAAIFGLYNRFTKRSVLTTGICRLCIDSSTLTMSCGGDRLAFAIQGIVHGCDPTKAIYIRIKSADIVIKVPKSADFGDDDFMSWREELKKRIPV